jgi:CelD/BcsL family acetyltransferase involved in cellulose biosynthesis
MHVERIHTAPQLASLAVDWNTLADSMPFRTWDWLGTWWKYYGSGSHRDLLTSRQLFVLAVYDDAEADAPAGSRKLIGIAPWRLDHNAIQGSVIRWIGEGEVCTDHLSLVCRPINASRVASAVAQALTSEFTDWDRLDLDNVDADDTTIAQLMTALTEDACQVQQHASHSYWVLDLPSTWDDYLASISKSHRKQLRQLERRVLESDRATWHRVESKSDLDRAWEVLVDLHQRRRQSLGEPGCFASQAFHDFHREVVDLLIDRSALRMSWMELDGIPAAAEYHLAGSDTTYAYQGGVDPQRLEDEPGRLSTILCLRHAIEEGHRQIDFLRGDEPYKAHWRATPRQTLNYRVIPNRPIARLRGQVLAAADTLADWARNSLQRTRGVVTNQPQLDPAVG